MKTKWQPAVSFEMLLARARLLEKLRKFMNKHGILEVETPILVDAAVSDPHIESFETALQYPGGRHIRKHFLHTSPEYAMKRLLASGSGPIYQICRVFRDNEIGKYHNPEFTMLEWYRPEYDHHQLMDELDELLQVLNFKPAQKKTYAEVFKEKTDLDPHTTALVELQKTATDYGYTAQGDERSVLLDFIFSHCVCDHLGHECPHMIYDFPVVQSALARIRHSDPPVAERFELFIHGLEIANGFHELCDAGEQKKRFVQDNLQREKSGKPEVFIDEKFIEALKYGLPPCAGVAVGVDRLLMAMHHCTDIREVIAFPVDRA
ncbi:MAG: EF-P lysine aminoacylase GenX [Gammaproteobacteria bacterium RIFCSPLOWO2_02_FULL_47_50]|jgi:lysyl-tRNA synthetase class 2|nr:MAG: EF-P lysine aminoacylase GenX [Gammaproteobacteria bacterium RIFCSPLOWO2_12_47_11]OGT78244.1 MAG: EF-P lysine aminoacylase GenX [Gammaproteobacteria bacterium RIFCSPLOWO2_02_FULL_47_50]